MDKDGKEAKLDKVHSEILEKTCELIETVVAYFNVTGHAYGGELYELSRVSEGVNIAEKIVAENDRAYLGIKVENGRIYTVEHRKNQDSKPDLFKDIVDSHKGQLKVDMSRRL